MGPINQQQTQKLKQLTVMSLAKKSKVRGSGGRLGGEEMPLLSVADALLLPGAFNAPCTKHGLLMPTHHRLARPAAQCLLHKSQPNTPPCSSCTPFYPR